MLWGIAAAFLQNIFNSTKVGLEISRLQLNKGTISTDSGSDIFRMGTAIAANNGEKRTRHASETDCPITPKIDPLIKSC